MQGINFFCIIIKNFISMRRILGLVIMLFPAISLWAQVTNSSITGVVKTSDGKVLEGATVTAIHQPSGTKYVVAAGKNGIYTMPSVRVGGPYSVSASYTGFQAEEQTDVYANLGSAANVDLTLSDSGK